MVDEQLIHKKKLAADAQSAEWRELVAVIDHLDDAQRAFLKEHPPGLVKALWEHFELTRDKCGCKTTSHERDACSVRLIERLLLDDEFH